MRVIDTVLSIGVEKPFSVWHMSDTHLTCADARDCDRKRKLAEDRTRLFSEERHATAEEMLAEARRLCKDSGNPLIYTGDLIDFTSAWNFELGKEFLSSVDCLFAVGNHEFSKYVGEAWEDDAYKADSADAVRNMIGADFSFLSRIINGVNFVAIDNNYYRFSEKQLEFLKKEVQKGLPVILAIHNPLYTNDLFRFVMGRSECAYLVATPEECMQSYSEYRYRQQLADRATLEMVRYIEQEPAIKAILAGHLHRDYEGFTDGGKPQIVTGFETIRKIYIR